MRIGKLEAKPGEHTFGFLEVTTSRSGLRVDIPIHLFAGAEPGPTLLVQIVRSRLRYTRSAARPSLLAYFCSFGRSQTMPPSGGSSATMKSLLCPASAKA